MVASPRLHLTTGSSLPITRFRYLENHFGVLSLEGFGLAGKPAAASAAGAILYYVRSTQRGTLDHVDRVGFYERQNYLVLDAVTVRNLELIEPLFAGTDAGVTLFRSSRRERSRPWASVCCARGCCAHRLK